MTVYFAALHCRVAETYGVFRPWAEGYIMGLNALAGNRNGLIEEIQRHFPEGLSKSTKYLNHLPGVTS